MWCTAGQLSRSLLSSIFTNDLPLALNKACLSMYADDSTIYASATTANVVTETLNKELQSVLEWMASNELVLNVSKTKSIVFCTNHSLSGRPHLKLVKNGVAVEQVEETKINWCCLRLSTVMVKTYRFNGCKDGKRSGRKKEMLCFFDSTLQKASLAGSSLV